MKLTFLYLVLLILFSCIYQNNSNQGETLRFHEDVVKKKEKKKKNILKTIEGKELFSIKNIIGDSILLLNKHNVILYYNGADCFTCIERSFQLLNELEKQLRINILVVGANSNFSNEQINFDYYDFIYYDEKEQIRRELRFVPTPVMFVIDVDYIIEKACFPHYSEGLEEQRMFKSYLKSLL